MNIKTNAPRISVSTSGTSGTGMGSTSSYNTTTVSITGSASCLSGTSGTIGHAGYVGYSSVSMKTKYIVLGKEIEVNGYKDSMTALYVSMINLNGKPFYDEVKKQGVDFPKEIEDYLEKAIISWNRNEKISSILEDDKNNEHGCL